MWHLQIYDIPLSAVEKMEMKLNKAIRNWLALPLGLCAWGIYSRSSMLNLPFISLVEEYKVAKCWQHMTLSLLSDMNICSQEIPTSTGRKWKAEVAIGRAIVAERNWELISAVQSHQHSIGFLPMEKPGWSKINNCQRNHLVTADKKPWGREADSSGHSAATAGSVDHFGSSHIMVVDLVKHKAQVADESHM